MRTVEVVWKGLRKNKWRTFNDKKKCSKRQICHLCSENAFTCLLSGKYLHWQHLPPCLNCQKLTWKLSNQSQRIFRWKPSFAPQPNDSRTCICIGNLEMHSRHTELGDFRRDSQWWLNILVCQVVLLVLVSRVFEFVEKKKMRCNFFFFFFLRNLNFRMRFLYLCYLYFEMQLQWRSFSGWEKLRDRWYKPNFRPRRPTLFEMKDVFKTKEEKNSCYIGSTQDTSKDFFIFKQNLFVQLDGWKLYEVLSA